MVQQVSFSTADGWEIKGDYHPGNSHKGALLMPMMNHGRSSFAPLVPRLHEQGYHVLAIDLRGHGQSTNKGSFRDFANAQFVAMESDCAGAIKLLKEKGAEEIVLIGASIGANLALMHAEKDAAVKKIVLLSPGMDYRGLVIEPAASSLRKPVLLMASKGDSYPADSCRKVMELAKGEKSIEIYEGNAHGTDMLAHAGALERIMGFLGG